MTFPDVNIFVYAAYKNSVNHGQYNRWVDELINGSEPFAVSEIILSSVVRLITNKKIFDSPFTIQEALTFAGNIRKAPQVRLIVPGVKHWDIFEKLCLELNPKSGSVTDAYLAALAIEHDCELVSADRGFSRYPDLRWKHLSF